jgi:hypothetical protein
MQSSAQTQYAYRSIHSSCHKLANSLDLERVVAMMVTIECAVVFANVQSIDTWNRWIVGIPTESTAALSVVVLGREQRDGGLVDDVLRGREHCREHDTSRKVGQITSMREQTGMACNATHGIRIAIGYLALKHLVSVRRVVCAWSR